MKRTRSNQDLSGFILATRGLALFDRSHPNFASEPWRGSRSVIRRENSIHRSNLRRRGLAFNLVLASLEVLQFIALVIRSSAFLI
jgi:hypothetical protein